MRERASDFHAIGDLILQPQRNAQLHEVSGILHYIINDIDKPNESRIPNPCLVLASFSTMWTSKTLWLEAGPLIEQKFERATKCEYTGNFDVQ